MREGACVNGRELPELEAGLLGASIPIVDSTPADVASVAGGCAIAHTVGCAITAVEEGEAVGGIAASDAAKPARLLNDGARLAATFSKAANRLEDRFLRRSRVGGLPLDS